MNVKRLFEEGRGLARIGDGFSSLRACIFLDLAIEQLLHMLILDFAEGATGERGDMKWEQLWEAAANATRGTDPALSAGIPNRRKLNALRKMRNLAQHHGIMPNPAETEGLIASVEQTIGACLRGCYGIDLSSFRLWSLVRNPELRRLLEESEEACDRGAYIASLVGFRIAHAKTMKVLGENAGGHAYRTAGVMLRFSNMKYHTDGELALAQAVQGLREDIAVVQMGLPLADSARFQCSASHFSVQETMGGMWLVQTKAPLDGPELERSARFCIGYLGSVVLAVQDSLPEALATIRIEVPLSEQPLWSESLGEAT